MDTQAPSPTALPRDRRVIKRLTRQDRRGILYIVAGAIMGYAVLAYFLFSPAENVMPGGKAAKAAAEAAAANPSNFDSIEKSYVDADGKVVRVISEYTVDLTNFRHPESSPAPAREADPAVENAELRSETILPSER